MARPVGVVLGLMPVTNPVATLAFAVMIAKAQEHHVPPPANVRVVNNTILSAETNAVRVGEVTASPRIAPL